MSAKQCECCASPLATPATFKGVQRNVCDKCLGFFARWYLDAMAKDAEQPKLEQPKP